MLEEMMPMVRRGTDGGDRGRGRQKKTDCAGLGPHELAMVSHRNEGTQQQ